MSTLAQDSQNLWSLLEPERRKYALGLTSLAFVNISDVLAPLFLAVAIDVTEAALTGGTPQTPNLLKLVGLSSADIGLTFSVISFLALHLLANVCRYPMLMLVAVPSHQIGQNIRNTLVDKLMRLPQPFYDRAKTGDLMSRATADVNAMRMMLGPGILVGSDTLFIMSMVIVVLLTLSWQLTLIAMIPLPLIYLFTNKLSHAEYQRFEAVQEDISELTERARESYAGIRILQGYAREGFDRERFEQYSWRHYLKNMELAKVRSVFDPTLNLMLGASTVLVLIFGGLRVIDATMTLGTFVAFLFLVRYLAGPMIGLGWSISLFQRGRASMGRLNTLLDEPIDIDDPPHPVDVPLQGQLEMRNLTFTYQGKLTGEGEDAIVDTSQPQEPALRHINLRVEAGQTLGIIGPVGSGKSSLSRLFVRLYDPPPGTVFIDGVDVRDLSLETLRRDIVMAPQDTFLFSDTVSRNITFGEAPQAEAKRCAALAQLDGEVQRFADGYDTMLGERGVNLSGGQRQRLAIARAIASDPKVLILDDCLSAVDAQTEEAILHNLRQVFAGRTGIIVSHRICAVRDCDQIIVLEDGEIQERGTHASLIAENGYYAAIARAQTEEELS